MPESVPLADLARILASASATSGLDFSSYRVSSMARRVRFRMASIGVGESREYADRVERDPGECFHLVDALLIKWMGMFREPSTFATLRSSVLPRIVRARHPRRRRHVRCWVPACSTGEDAYSLGMCLLEAAEATRAVSWSIVASDVDRTALAAVGRGVLGPGSYETTPPELARRWLERRGAFVRVDDAVLMTIENARHDVVGSARLAPQMLDEAESDFDVVLCRNLLFYLTPMAQERLIERLLKVMLPGAVLVVGISDSLPGSVRGHLQREDSRAPIYWVR